MSTHATEPTAPRPHPAPDADLEAYADRLQRHRARLEDDIAAARTWLAWGRHETAARRHLSPHDVRALEAAGILAAETHEADDLALISRRTEQIQALDLLQAFTTRAIRNASETPSAAIPEA